jgi:hypothetical protein
MPTYAATLRMVIILWVTFPCEQIRHEYRVSVVAVMLIRHRSIALLC